MDCFDSRYYWVSRRLLTLIGQWPYQDRSVRFRRMIVFSCTVVSFLGVQVMKLLTSKRTPILWSEIIGNELATLIAVIKYFSYTVYDEKLRNLMESMKTHWNSLNDDDEIQIIREISDDARMYSLRSVLFIFTSFTIGIFLTLLAPIIDFIMPLNESRSRTFLYPAEYFIDQQKYFYPIMTHMIFVVGFLVTAVLATDTMYMTYLHHASGMFKLVSHRLEHALDHSEKGSECRFNGRDANCSRIAIAVEYHRRALSFTDDIVAIYEWPHFFSLFISLVSTSLSLYSAVMLKEKGTKMPVGLMFGIAQMFHLFIMVLPPQMLIDSSGIIPYKAYSSKWYAAPVTAQALLLLIMQRGMKPRQMVVGRMYALSVENYCSEVQTSISYFTVLLSLK